ncbi:hypothetical protein [Pseudodesulfovibrio piezophilus]|uniref:Uncharacterized protein n=1 Tax=Pseudodesulfovibrio piezophilus (strain DSM 21447 / JCM 15486 / C1TLV30) TaxID=1322246 RepID=M1WKE3_PSEP2|nr:hypothetical protein [Pseudodesulfovibrio piezophilus]CCH49451.1 conserved protein of unknown function [Pseudodesulfovibrio piezophilus C1TLV30]
MSQHINELFDKDGNLIGALLTAEAWTHVRKEVLSALGVKEESTSDIPREPLSDWETLKQYWDFSYPVDTNVHCEHCGNDTLDWAADEPRRFYLTSANLAGLVAFRCANCHSKIQKKHFKDEIKVECTPFQPDKDSSKEARY